MAVSINTLSGSTDGKPIKISGTASGSANTLHTAGTGVDKVTIYCHNNDTTARELVILWGGATTDEEIKRTIPPKEGVWLVIDSMAIKNSLTIKAYCATTNVLFVTGHYTRES